MERQIHKLESLRGFAAVYVLFHHVSTNYLGLANSIWGLPFRFGQEAVMAFFLLSGFVIHYSTHREKVPGYRTYFLKRARRIYPIFILALMLSFAIACWNARGILFSRDIFVSLAGNLAMLQDRDNPGRWFAPFSGNIPLWSLSYEWWFYMLYFPICQKVAPARQRYWVIALCILGLAVNSFWPNPPGNVLMLFPIWWWGVELAREYLATKTITWRGQAGYLGLLIVPVGYYLAASVDWVLEGKRVALLYYPFVNLRFYVAGVGIFVAGMIWGKFQFRGYRWLLHPFSLVSTFSYALYVFHFPIICDFRIFSGTHWYYADLAARIGLVFALSLVVERYFQRWINRRWVIGR